MVKPVRAYDTRVRPYLEEIKEWRKQGGTFQDIAQRLGVTSSFLSAKCKIHPSLAEALQSIPLTEEERLQRAVTAKRYRKRSLNATKIFIRKQASLIEKWEMVSLILGGLSDSERVDFQKQVARWEDNQEQIKVKN